MAWHGPWLSLPGKAPPLPPCLRPKPTHTPYWEHHFRVIKLLSNPPRKSNNRISGKQDSDPREQSEAFGGALLLEADGNDGGSRDSDMDDSWALDGSMDSKKKCVMRQLLPLLLCIVCSELYVKNVVCTPGSRHQPWWHSRRYIMSLDLFLIVVSACYVTRHSLCVEIHTGCVHFATTDGRVFLMLARDGGYL